MAKGIAELIITLKDKVSAGLGNIGGRLDKLAQNVEKSKFIWAGLAGAVGFAGTAFISAANKMEGWQISFETMLGSADKAKALMNDVRKFAAATPFELTEVIQGTKGLLAFGIETEKLIPTLKNLGDVSAGLGVPMERLILNFGQVAAQGKLTGREIRDFAVAGVPLLKTLADQMGTTEGAIADMASQGKISFADVDKAFQSMAGEGGKFNNLMARQMETLTGKISNVKDMFFQLSAELGKSLLPAAKQVADVFLKVMDAISKISPETQKMILVITGLIGLFAGLLAGMGALVTIAPALAAAWLVILSPIGLIALGITGAVTAFLFFRDEVNAVVEFVKALFEGFVESFRGVFDTILEAVMGFIEPFLEAWTQFFELIMEQWEIFKEIFLEQIDEFIANLTEKWESWKNDFFTVWEFITGKVLGENSKVVTDVKKSVGDMVKASSDAWKKLLLDLQKSHLDRKTAQDKANAERIAANNTTLGTEVANEQAALAKRATLRQQFVGKMKATYVAAQADQIGALQSTFSTIEGLSSSHNKALFAVGKAAGIANAIINTAMGVSRALGSAPPPLNIALAALVGAAGLVQIQKIGATSMAEGGMVLPTSGGTFSQIGEAGKAEAVIPLDDDETKDKLRDTLGGGGTTININAGVLVADDDALRQLASMIDEKLFELKANNETVSI